MLLLRRIEAHRGLIASREIKGPIDWNQGSAKTLICCAWGSNLYAWKIPPAGRGRSTSKRRADVIKEARMRGVIRIGALALVLLGNWAIEGVRAPASAQDVVLTMRHVALVKHALRLTQAQEPLWRSVEVTVRDIIAEQAHHSGVVHRVSARPASLTLDSSAMQRIATAAQPLIASFDETQKRNATAAARMMGVASLF
jgi:hypothetical protein